MKLLICLAFITFFSFEVNAQSNVFYLQIHLNDNPSLQKKIKYTKEFTNRELLQKEITKTLFQLRSQAYLTADIDSITEHNYRFTAYLKSGLTYQWAKVNTHDKEFLSNAGFSTKHLNGERIKNNQLVQEFNKVLTWCENNGYPFAEIKLDSIRIDSQTVSAVIVLYKNELITVDSVIIKGKCKTSPTFIQSYLSLKAGDRYNEKNIVNIKNKIKSLSIVKEDRPSEILFIENKCKIYLFLSDKPSSKFDGVLGMLPDNKTGKILFTGDVKMRLQNAFKKGENIELNWRKLQTQTQDLKSKVVIPFLFKTPFGTDLQFKLYKRDSTFLEVNPNIGLMYHLSGSNYFKVFVNRKTSTLLSTKHLINYTTLPPYADIDNTQYGIGFRSENLDYVFNPRSGYQLSITTAAGVRKIKKNENLNPIVYNNLSMQTASYNGELTVEYYFPILKRSTLKTAIQGGFLYAPSLFNNEAFRIGGLRSLRGFDEESVNATTFGIFTTEYRFLLETNSAIFLFGDFAYYENNCKGINYVNDFPIGFGAGINFETKAGIFTLSYALGKSFDNPIYLRSGKIHFGLVNYF